MSDLERICSVDNVPAETTFLFRVRDDPFSMRVATR